MRVDKVISGGQTGVDQAALRAAVRLGIPTGGFAPRGYVTLEGPKPNLLRGYGLVALPGGYAQRTEQNVRGSDGTLRIASNFRSAGEKLTKLMTMEHKKPRFDVLIDSDWLHNEEMKAVAARAIRAWFRQFKVRVLNVAGNSEQTSPGIGAIAEAFLFDVLR